MLEEKHLQTAVMTATSSSTRSNIRQLYGWPEKISLDLLSRPRQHDPHERLKISIVIPTLNQAETIEDTLLSILYQDYKNFEIIVMDGGSTDATLKVLEPYRPHLSHLISQKDEGQSQAINQGFGLATGSVFAWINSDDYYLPTTFTNVAKVFAANSSVDFIVGAGDVVSLDNKFLRFIPPLEMNDYTLRNWKNDRWIMQQSCFWRSSLWHKVNGVDESLGLLMDYDLWFRFSKLTNTYTMPEKLAVMRYYPEIKTIRQRAKTKQELAFVYAKNGLPDEVRELVSEIVNEQAVLVDRLNHIEKSLAVRILKRFSLFPKS